MSDNPFDTDNEIRQLIESINSLVDDADASLATAATLDAPARAYIAGKLEEMVNEYVGSLLETSEEELEALEDHVRFIKNGAADSGSLAADVAKGWDTMTKIVGFILDNKEGEILPTTRRYMQEAAKLSDEEYARPECHGKILVAIASPGQSFGTSSATGANPFRRKEQQHKEKAAAAEAETRTDLHLARLRKLTSSKPANPFRRNTPGQ